MVFFWIFHAIFPMQKSKNFIPGTFIRNGKRQKINGDVGKLHMAANLSNAQKQLLANMRFRCAQVSGTQEMRTKIGHIGTWAAVQYGLGIFMTISPGERHNYLALRLCRYRGGDPFVACDTENAKVQKPYIGMSKPSLELKTTDIFGVDVPGYDLRRIMQAQDPLCVVNAFFVQIVTILATCLGARMCPSCPHCSTLPNPCQDSFGSVAEPLGGFAGRTDAIFGAKECQKSNGSLHLHFFAFTQRLHQFSNMAEIAARLEKGLVQASDLKNYINNICCTSYPDVAKFKEERDTLEQNFPRYAEWQEDKTVPENLRCREIMLGQIPAFVRSDATTAPSVSITQLYPQMGQPSEMLSESDKHILRNRLAGDAATFKKKFLEAQQYFQSRCQHHIHKLDPKSQKRVIPNACRCASRPQECKHEAPWTSRMNEGEPLLVCRGIAKAKGLPCSGARNCLSTVLMTRNEEWVNGTLPGFLLAFGGSNSDTKPNDLLPIIECTHEPTCNKRCVRKNNLKQSKKLIRLAQRIQATTNGYFGGYVGKKQPGGKAELKKCINHMYTLRNKIQGQSQHAKQRAVSGRMITDLEMNGTYRGAVEVFNLCRHLDAQDVLMAECVRTFDTTNIDGRAWLNRLIIETGNANQEVAEWEMLVPKSKKATATKFKRESQ